MFLKPKANLPDAEKSRIEFCLQQIAECIGFDRFTLPVLSRKTLFGLYEGKRNPQSLIEFVGDHLAHDVDGIQFRAVPKQATSGCGSGCGGGSCGGISGLPYQYDEKTRTITLHVEIDGDPRLEMGALINGVVGDLLYQNQFVSAHLPEMVDLAVAGTGLGMIRSNITLVKKVAACWDSTQWEVSPRPFLDCRSLAYANAIAAWARDDAKPEWATDLPSDVKRPMGKSLKYLSKTGDSFFEPQSRQSLLAQSPSDWWKLATHESVSNQVISIRHLESDGHLSDQQESLLLGKLRSANIAIVLHAVAATERMAFRRPSVASESLVIELRSLADHRDDQVRAKAMCALARLGKMDDAAVETAAVMLEESQRHLVFAGVYALSTLQSVPDHVLVSFDRCFVRRLRACDYELIDLFVVGYRRWLDDPSPHFKGVLRDSPEHLPIALETLLKVTDHLVPLRVGA
ncbi:MAG: hypothetical protein AAGJ40_08530 [Planctomycetota bacterium]